MQSESSMGSSCNFADILQKPFIRRFIVVLLFVSALGIRLIHITRPPLDFAPIRQYQSAHIARGIYVEKNDSVPESGKQIARINMERMGFLLEPRLMENISVIGYRISGNENLWIPRVLSSIFWTIGGIFIYLTACTLASPGAAFFSAAFFVLLPYGISASRSFQPDPLMTMLIACGIYLILRYYKHPSLWKLLSASIVSSLAMLLKPYSVFITLGAFVSLMLYRHGLRKSIINRDVLIFLFLSIMPPATYYISGILTDSGLIRQHTQSSFLPHLLLEPYFWKDWLVIIGRVIGYLAFAGALTGLFISRGLVRAMLVGLWIGYFVFGFMFTYHIHTHDYYQLLFIPVVALSLIPVATAITNKFSLFLSIRQIVFLSITVIVFIAGTGYFVRSGNLRDYKNYIKPVGAVIGVHPDFYKFITSDFEKEVRAAREIGEIVGHSTSTVFLTSDYGRSLAYHGKLSGLPWPISISMRDRKEMGTPIPDRKELFNPRYLMIRTYKSKLFKGKQIYEEYIRYTPDYFIVTDFEEFEKQPDLKDFLYNNFPVISKSEDYLIFDLRKMSE